MMELGKTIARLRQEAKLSQEKLAELLGVSRQAVTKWESGKSNPDTENLIRLAQIFGVSVDELCRGKAVEKTSEPKMNYLLAAISPAIFIIYIIFSAAAKTIHAETIICLFVICFPMNLAVQLFFGNAVKNGDFSMIAGFDPSVEYNFPEVKRYLVALGWFLNILTIFHSLLIAMTTLIIGGGFVHFLVVGYIISYIVGVLFMGYKFSDKIYVNEKDARLVKKVMPSTVMLMGIFFAALAEMILIFELRGIKNNTLPALEMVGMLFLVVGFAFAAYFVEEHRLKKSDEHEPLFGKAFIVLNLLAVAVMVLMAII